MKIKTIFLVLIFTFTTLCCSGCWDQVELDSIAIITGIGLDKAEGDNIELLLQVGNVSQLSSKQGSESSDKQPSTLFSIKAPTFMSAMDKIQSQFSRSPFLHHNQAIIIGRELAKDGIVPYFDSMLRQTDMRLDVFIVISDTTAKDILNANVGPEKISSFSLNSLLKAAVKHSDSLAPRFFDILTEFMHPYCNIGVPIISLIEQEDNVQLFEYKSMAVLKNLEFYSTMNEQIMNGYTWLRGAKLHKKSIRTITEDGYVDFELKDIKTKVDVNLKDNLPKIDVKVKTKAIISGVQGYVKVDQSELEEYFKSRIKASIYAEISDTIEYSKEIGSDLFCWGQSLHQHHYQKWHKVKDSWKELYKNLIYDIDIKLDLIGSKDIRGGILKDRHDR